MRKFAIRASRHIAHVGITALGMIGLNALNELCFSHAEQSYGINWMFLPAGVRLLATLLFGLAGFEGLLLAGIYLNFLHFEFHNDFRAWSGALAGALGPWLASSFARAWFDPRGRLQAMTPPRLLITGLLCGMMSPIFHHAFTWVETGLVDWHALAAMTIGDTAGILVVLFAARRLALLAERHDLAASWRARWPLGKPQ